MIIGFVTHILSCQRSVLALSLFICVLSLTAAYTAQFSYDLEPCILCLYQRVPFLVVILLSAIGLVMKPWRRAIIGLCALAFAVNAGIAFYHFGVEERWWVSVFEGCDVPAEFFDPAAADTRSLLDELMKKPSVPCTQVAWLDPVFRMSMAFYNIWLCIGMFGFCALSLVMLKRPLPKS